MTSIYTPPPIHRIAAREQRELNHARKQKWLGELSQLVETQPGGLLQQVTRSLIDYLKEDLADGR